MNVIRHEIFSLNDLSIEELKLKWYELFNNNPPNLKKNFLIKELAYKIQFLRGYNNNISEEEIKLSTKLARKRIEEFNKNNNKNNIILLPPPGSIITKIHKGQEYKIKVIETNKFECRGMIFKSLSSLATYIAGTRWSGYAFFNLQRKVKEIENWKLKIEN